MRKKTKSGSLADQTLIAKLRLRFPLIVAPMAGGPSSPSLVSEASRAGALGSMGAAYSNAAAIEEFAATVRRSTDRPFGINLFVPHSMPEISSSQIARAIADMAEYRNELGLPTPVFTAPYEENFDMQFEAVLRVRPAVLSFIFGVLPDEHIAAARREKIVIIGTATSLEEARSLDDAGVDAIVLQGIEAGGGIFDASGLDQEIPTFQLLDACVSKLGTQLIAAGGIMDSNGIQAALRKGAQAVQMGTAFLACHEAGTSNPYRAKLLDPSGRKTRTTRVFSGRLARGMENRFMEEMQTRSILPFPAQNSFTRDIRSASAAKRSADFLFALVGYRQR